MKKTLVLLTLALGIAVLGAFSVSIAPKATQKAGFALAAFTLPGYNVVIKITEKAAAACDDPAGCEGE